jgi:hypothetical protein
MNVLGACEGWGALRITVLQAVQCDVLAIPVDNTTQYPSHGGRPQSRTVNGVTRVPKASGVAGGGRRSG